MNNIALDRTISAFNNRNFKDAARQAAEGLATASGSDEAFWMGLQEACEGFTYLMDGKYAHAESRLVLAMRTMRNFGFRYGNFEVTSALAGIRRVVEEIRLVRAHSSKVFDLSLLPRLKMAAKADD